MNVKAKINLSLDDRSAEGAKKLFQMLAIEAGLANKKIRGWKVDSFFKEVNNNKAILPYLMRQSDLLSAKLLGGRIWDVFYVLDESASYGLTTAPPDGSPDVGYGTFPVLEASVSKLALMTMICNLALYHIVIELRDVIDFNLRYPVYKRASDNVETVWRFPDYVELLETFTSTYMDSISKELGFKLEIENEPMELGV